MSQSSIGQDLQFTPKIFYPALLHQLSRTGSPIHSENFRSSVAPPTVKYRFSNSHRRLSIQRCSTNCQGQVLQFTEDFLPALLAPKTFVPALLHQLSRTVLQFTPKTFAPALLHQLSRTGSPIHTEDFRSALLHQLSRTGSPIHTEDFHPSAAPPAVKDRFQFTPKTFAPALLHQLSRTGSPIHTEDFRPSAAPPTVKDRFPNSHRRLSLSAAPPTVKTGSPIHTEDFRSSAAPPTVKDRFSNSHRRLSFQRCSTNCQGQDLQFTPKTFAAALLHQLSRAGSPIHTEDFGCSATPPTVKDRISNSNRRLSFRAVPPTVKDRISKFTSKTLAPALLHQMSRTGSQNSHRGLSSQRCSTNCQGQVLQFALKTFAPALLHQLSRTGSPIHTEDFRSSAAPPTVKDRFSNSHRRLSFQRCSTNCQGQDLQFTPKTFVPALLHQLSKTGSPTHAEDFRSSAAPPTVKDRFSNSLRKLSIQRCSTNCQGQ